MPGSMHRRLLTVPTPASRHLEGGCVCVRACMRACVCVCVSVSVPAEKWMLCDPIYCSELCSELCTLNKRLHRISSGLEYTPGVTTVNHWVSCWGCGTLTCDAKCFPATAMPKWRSHDTAKWRNLSYVLRHKADHTRLLVVVLNYYLGLPC